jgi:hypothetical protein
MMPVAGYDSNYNYYRANSTCSQNRFACISLPFTSLVPPHYSYLNTSASFQVYPALLRSVDTLVLAPGMTFEWNLPAEHPLLLSSSPPTPCHMAPIAARVMFNVESESGEGCDVGTLNDKSIGIAVICI